MSNTTDITIPHSGGGAAILYGVVARVRGLGRADCPHEAGSALAWCWGWGWDARARGRVARDGAIVTRETKPVRTGFPWADIDLAVLAACGPDVADSDVAGILSRSRQSVTGKRHRLKAAQAPAEAAS